MIHTKRRSEFEIVQELLSLAIVGSKKTPLMYRANMCYSQFNEYLHQLLEKKFIETRVGNPHGTLYFTTEKGKKLLESVNSTLLQAKKD
jgi:predicted transcriptional regulator